MRFLLAIFATGIFLSGCGCTDAGCVGYVEFNVREGGALPGVVSASYIAEGGRRGEICCAGEYEACDGRVTPLCIEGGFRVEGEPSSIDVTITATQTGATYSGVIEPEYGDGARPNGPFCGPVCHSANVSITLE